MAQIDPVLLKARLGALAGRFDVDALAECDSTSSELLRRAELGAPSGSVIVADQQSAGRGRRGRSWLSSPEASLTFSMLWRFPGNPAQLSGLSLAVGVGLARALDSLGARGVRLKWPNDVLIDCAGDYAKLAGILIELASDRRGTQAVIGIGLNLMAPSADLPQAALGLAEAGVSAERHEVLAAILGELAGTLDTFAGGSFKALKAAWQAHHAWQDQPVRIIEDGRELLAGRCLGVDDDGALLLETGAGVERVFAGDVSLRRA